MTKKEQKSSASDFSSDFPSESRMEFDATISRMVQAIGGKSQEDLASFFEISKDAIYKAGRQGKIPPAWFLTIGKKAGISIDWLVSGVGPMRPGNAQAAPAETQKPAVAPEDDLPWMAPEAAPSMGYALVPKVKARLCAGTGSLETEGEVIGYYAFKLDFLQKKGRPKKMVLMDVAGDSMEPDVWNGDTVLIDESQRDIIAGAMFAVGIENEVFVKYLLRIPGKLVLKSKNSEYDPIEVDMNGDLAGAVRIIGRVVWSCREYVR
ncbi:LexA family transcriptional regulator [Solidesulfovibrio carbinolicus]|uniref:Phage repressor protein n=1 Tax=Solidesulfovibrio carbinolicus TaxID=296842 RepID=A0A4P6I045_9BACT|nr:S24 family peptidase [Solidesulfovibrio carbinolicus]QAZ67059.1 phage repressor protein [Solidesulfovibrio carbinolicus]